VFYMTRLWCVSGRTGDRGGRCRVSVSLRPVAAPLTADGEKDKAWGNETIRWNPVAEDRDHRPDRPARPGSPGPFGAAG